MDLGTWDRLSRIDQSEVRQLSDRFIAAVFELTAKDGWEFSQLYAVKESDGVYFIAPHDSTVPLGGIQSTSRAVMEALFTDAVQNYGR